MLRLILLASALILVCGLISGARASDEDSPLKCRMAQTIVGVPAERVIACDVRKIGSQ
jgi:hypothetical protein